MLVFGFVALARGVLEEMERKLWDIWTIAFWWRRVPFHLAARYRFFPALLCLNRHEVSWVVVATAPVQFLVAGPAP